MTSTTRKALALVVGTVILIGASSATTAVATRLITGAEIADRSITGADIKPQSVPGNRLERGSVGLKHLDRSSVRAGHAHSGLDPIVIDRQQRTAQPRDSNLGIPLQNGARTNIVNLTNLPAGTYAVSGSGEIGLSYIKQGSTYYYNTATCYLSALGTDVASQGYGSNVANGNWILGTIALSRVITLPSGGNIALQCRAFVSTPTPMTGYTGMANADLIALPVTSYSAG